MKMEVINLRLHKNFMEEGLTSEAAMEKLSKLSRYMRKQMFTHWQMMKAADSAKTFSDLKPEEFK